MRFVGPRRRCRSAISARLAGDLARWRRAWRNRRRMRLRLNLLQRATHLDDSAERVPAEHRQVVDQLTGADPRVGHPGVGGQLDAADDHDGPRHPRPPVSMPSTCMRRRNITASIRAMICSESAMTLLLPGRTVRPLRIGRVPARRRRCRRTPGGSRGLVRRRPDSTTVRPPC